ncbi:DHA2 family efflux MFS transporter permease subunit [Mycobacterium sp. ITM-2016-00316]|uniref:DHA2 family efflux MFS transporter permease subunit n=1 Tax=Mycobacterium sp. ITM-2016-00316 TaxID=2099695 RepID=UPI000CF91CE0|nr:DHA2 family efflux MFS transporter permease subunit [Mycobacterium sp. ITM-2016-00316]WNG82062.1 DHA2 family efflux MFS transporter permease subunit [Mycobacterium sp. ITM-2016-00316]
MTTATARPGAVLVITSSAAFLATLDLFIVNIAFPAISADFTDSDFGQMSWVLNGYTVVFAAVLALAGRLADRYGHRRVFLIGLAIFTIASAACALAPSLWALVAARVVQGVGAALVTPTSLSLLLNAWPAERRASAVGTWASVGAVAAALGPPLGGVLVAAGWQWVFLVNVPIGIVTVVAAARILREVDNAPIGRPDLLGAAFLVLGVGSLAYALVEVPERGWTATVVFASLTLSVLGMAAVVIRSRRHPVPALDLAVLRVPQFALATVMMLAFSCGFAGMLLVNVLYLASTWGWSAQAAGLGLAAGPVVVVVVARVANRVAARLGVGTVATLGALSFTAGSLWWLWRLGPSENYLYGLLPGQLLTGLGVGLILPTLSSVVGSALPGPRWGSGSSLINTARQVGSVLGIALVVTVVGTHIANSPTELASIQSGWALLAAAGVTTAIAGVALSVVDHRTSLANKNIRDREHDSPGRAK